MGTHEPPKTQLSSLLPNEVNPNIHGTQRKDLAMHVRRSIDVLDSNSLENLRLDTLKEPHDAITEIKRIVHHRQPCLTLAAEVSSNLGDEMLVEFVEQLTVINQLDRHEILYELDLLDRFIQKLQYEKLRRTSTSKPQCDDCGSHWRLNSTCNHGRHQERDHLSQQKGITEELQLRPASGS